MEPINYRVLESSKNVRLITFVDVANLSRTFRVEVKSILDNQYKCVDYTEARCNYGRYINKAYNTMSRLFKKLSKQYG